MADFFLLSIMASTQNLLQIFSSIDLTSLESTDHGSNIGLLLKKANTKIESRHVAAVCVYPNLGDFVKSNIETSIKTAVVGGYFPSGQTLTEAKVEELKLIEKTTVDEVDIVINRGALLAGDYDYVRNELRAMRQAVPSKILKIILETGELKSADQIRLASEIAIECGADFIKTSTGKSSIGATPEAAEIMCEVIKNHFAKTGKKIGFKPSGGIRTIEQAITYLEIVKRVNGANWIQPELFRIGASTLYDAVISELGHGNNA
ncbi:MAG: deoxyribose-phosphate aldolase [Crocinitomicaceae bacterium]|nr:deoxyribose-phosphate aldolase [Crocinitomicaceae bacterium]